MDDRYVPFHVRNESVWSSAEGTKMSTTDRGELSAAQ